MCRDVLVGIFATDDGGGEDRICRGETGGNNEGGEEVESRDERIYKRSRDEPALQSKSR